MEEKILFDILNDINTLYSYSEFLPENYKESYLSDLKNIIRKISFAKVKNSSNNDASQENLNINHNNEEIKALSVFEFVTESMIPRIISINNKVLPKDMLKILNFVDGEKSFYQIYKENKEKYSDFLEFANVFCELESKRYIYFTQKTDSISKRGWIKIGELLSEGNVILPLNIHEAMEFKKNSGKMFIGEALIELSFISEKTLRESLKIQKWISKTIENISK